MKTVMIIDDSESDQFLTTHTIEEFNSDVKIYSAYDGQEALEMLNALDNPPDVIFLDINMPRMNGLEFLEEYSKQDSQSTVVTMLTSSSQLNDKDKAMSYDCVKKYFMKLLDHDDMMTLAHQIL